MDERWQKRPIVIDAVRASLVLLAAAHDWKALPPWLAEAYERGDVIFARDHVSIRTLEGTHRADPDDMIIRGVKGELYPCKPDIFALTYERAES